MKRIGRITLHEVHVGSFFAAVIRFCILVGVCPNWGGLLRGGGKTSVGLDSSGYQKACRDTQGCNVASL